MIERNNNIGFLRLVFASLVVIGHAPELIDGDRHREPLTMLFHSSFSLGDASVDAFFLLSGYLITMSAATAPSLGVYLRRRALRVYPAFVVAYLACIFVMGPFVGHSLADLRFDLARMPLLERPQVQPQQLIGLPYPDLNGAMWTIPIEFRCYLLIGALAAGGWLARKRVVAALALGLVAASVASTFEPVQQALVGLNANDWVRLVAGGGTLQVLRLTSVFLVGSSFYLWREALTPRLTGPVAAVSAAAAAGMMFNPHLAGLGLTLFGGAAVFWLALRARLGPLGRINSRWDISYGAYLYAWPIASTILYFDRGISPVALATLSLALALLAGVASWLLVERWTMNLFRSPPRPATAGPAAPQAAAA